MLRFMRAAILVVVIMSFRQCLAEDRLVAVTNLLVQNDYVFARGSLSGFSSASNLIIDTLVTTNLLGEWKWIDGNRVEPDASSAAILVVPQVLGLTNMPKQLFLSMVDRESANTNMYDRDSDGSPNVYEFYNNTNPYVADFEDSPRIAVAADCEYSQFTNALWSSNPYSIIEISGEMYFSDSIDLPGWPLLISGPTNGYAVIHSSADIGVFMVNRRQTDHTLIRNVYLTMDKKSSFQAGFWVGGNLPWAEEAAGASFENVRLRMYNPGTWYYGWHMYGVTDTPIVIRDCVISAAGAADVVPVYVYGDSQVVVTNVLELINMPGEPRTEGYTFSGYALNKQYDQENDSDGDGISDYDEIHVYGTDLYLKDSDGDRIQDMIELSHGANPTNQDVYCFSLIASLTNDYCDIAGLKLAFFDSASGIRLSEIATATNRTDEISLHCISIRSEKPILRMWSVSEDSSVVVSYAIKGHDNVTSVQTSLISSLYDFDHDEIPDAWEIVHGMSSSDADDALEDFDDDGLINLHEYWAGTDPYVGDGTNTLLSICAKSVDIRIAGRLPEASLCKFDDYTVNGTNFVLNSSFWAEDIDTSCASMWNDSTRDYWGGACSQWHKAGTAISKRHIITAWHYAIPIGTTIWFMGNDGTQCSRVVTGCRSVGGDICVQLLDLDLPDNVVPAKILPKRYGNYIGSAKRLPVVTFDQEEKLIVSDSAALAVPSSRSEASGALQPYDSVRASFYENMVSGDSGNPRFLVVGNEVVLLSVMHYGGTGSGCFVTPYKEDIQRAMDLLCPGYELEEIDLNDYDQLD